MRVRTLFVSMHDARLVDIGSPFDALPSRGADTVALIAECIRAQCSSHHSTICDFRDHHDANNVNGDPRYVKRQYAAFKDGDRKCMPSYIDDAFQSKEQDTPFRVVLGDALDQHLADFKEDAVV